MPAAIVIIGGLGNDAAYFKPMRTRMASADASSVFVPLGPDVEARAREALGRAAPSERVLVGNSLGAMVALQIAADTPVPRLILVNPPSLHEASRLRPGWRGALALTRLRERAARALLRTLSGSRRAGTLLRHVWRRLYTLANPDAPDAVVKCIFDADLGPQAALLTELLSTFNFFDALRERERERARTSEPRVTRVIFGSQDEFSHLARAIRDHFEHVAVRSYDGAHHHALYHFDEMSSKIVLAL